MSAISVTKLYDQLSGKIGKETAENLTTFIDDKIEQAVENKLNKVESRFNFMESKFAILESKIDNLTNRMDNMATKTDVAESKSEIMKWMFIFWVGQAAITFGFIMLYIKK